MRLVSFLVWPVTSVLLHILLLRAASASLLRVHLRLAICLSHGLLQADYPSVDEVLQEIEGSTAASANALEQDIYGQYAWEREVERYE